MSDCNPSISRRIEKGSVYFACSWTQAGCLDVCVLHENDSVDEAQYDKVSKRKATHSPIPLTLFLLRSIHATWIAHGTHQASALPLLAFKTFVLPRNQGVEETGGKCRNAGDSSLHFGVCFKSLPSKMLLTGSTNPEITGPHCVNRPCGCSRR